MKIVCTLLRQGGTVVEFGEKFLPAAKYHFKPESDGGPHVADVTNKTHIARLLALSEAYELYDQADAPTGDTETGTGSTGAATGAGTPEGAGTEGATTGDVPLDQRSEEEIRAYALEKYNKTFHHNAKAASMLAEIANLGG